MWLINLTRDKSYHAIESDSSRIRQIRRLLLTRVSFIFNTSRRSRPTLKPSTEIVSKAQEFIDIYRYPPIRPGPIYPTPQVDKPAAKCRKDVCLLPDCSCGGSDIPGKYSLFTSSIATPEMAETRLEMYPWPQADPNQSSGLYKVTRRFWNPKRKIRSTCRSARKNMRFVLPSQLGSTSSNRKIISQFMFLALYAD